MTPARPCSAVGPLPEPVPEDAAPPPRHPCITSTLAVLLATCTVEPLGLRPRPATLIIDNPARWSLQLDAVDGDRCRRIAEPGTVAHARFRLLPGAYVVRALGTAGPVSLPAPLFDAALPADRAVLVRVPTRVDADHDDPGFAFVPAGPAVIGDTLGVGQPDERPARIVWVPAFRLGRREVTNRDYAAFLNAAEPDVDAGWCAFDSRKCLVTRDADGHWSTTSPDFPVVTVGLAGAEAFCRWRTAVTGVRCRLPTEIEWEKAARGPESFTFAYGNEYRRLAANQESGALAAAGGLPPNGFGLHDMTGNAFEWTADAYRTAVGTGATGSADPGQGSTPWVLRGGSFVLDGMYLRNSFRMRLRPEVRTDDIGFRVAQGVADQDPETPR